MKRFKNRFVVTALVLLFAALPAIAFAALSTSITQSISLGPGSHLAVPASVISDWQTLVTAIDTADNSGSIVLNPGGITRSAQRKMNMGGFGTTVQFRIRYTTGTTITAGTIQPFGFDGNGAPERLFDSSGTHALAFLSDATNDAQDGTYSYTASQEVDANAAASVMAAIKVAATGTGAATAVVQCRVK